MIKFFSKLDEVLSFFTMSCLAAREDNPVENLARGTPWECTQDVVTQ